MNFFGRILRHTFARACSMLFSLPSSTGKSSERTVRTAHADSYSRMTGDVNSRTHACALRTLRALFAKLTIPIRQLNS